MNLKSLFNNIFSVKYFDKHTVLTILGIKLKIKSKENETKIYLNQILYMMNSCCDITKCKPAEGNLRKLQLLRLKGFKLALKIFDKYNIQYWMDGGSLIGTYRHKGFIPWDDDIDIVIPRKDYLRAKNALNTELEGTNLIAQIGGKNKTQVLRLFDKETDFSYFDMFPYDFSDNKNLSREELLTKLEIVKKQFYPKYTKRKIEEHIPEILESYKTNNITTSYEKGCRILNNYIQGGKEDDKA